MHSFLVRGALLVAAACGGAATSPPVLEAPQPLPDPEPPRVGFSIDPHQLGEADIDRRIRHRTRVARWGKASLAHDGEPIDPSTREHDRDLDVILPVIDASGTKIQVVVEEDHARYAVWIDARDTWETLLARTRLDATSTREPAAPGGVVLEAGAPIEAGARSPRRAVTVRDDEFDIRGFVDERRIGRVYVVPLGDPKPHQMKRRGSRPSWKPPRERRPIKELDGGTPIRARPSSTAIPIATPKQHVVVAIVAERDEGKTAWTEIEIVREYLRIRGFVPSHTLAETDGFGRLGTIGIGSAFGMSHADRIQLPTGTCLYDGIEGAVVGVQLDPQERLGRAKLDKPGWSLVYINTPWRHTPFYVRDAGSDPSQPQWESCTAK